MALNNTAEKIIAFVKYHGLEQPVVARELDTGGRAFFRLEEEKNAFEISGDAGTDNDYLALAKEYGAQSVRRPDPVAAKQSLIREFGATAVRLGVPPELEAEAAEQLFKSAIRTTEKIHKETDRGLRRAKMPVVDRGDTGDFLVKFYDALPPEMRSMIMENNVRPYVGLYQPLPSDPDDDFDADDKPGDFVVVTIPDTSTAAFQDIGRYAEATNVFRHAADILKAGIPSQPVALVDTNGNPVGTLETAAEQPRACAVHDGSIQVVLDARGIEEEKRPHILSSAMHDASTRLLSQRADDVLFLVQFDGVKPLGVVRVNQPPAPELADPQSQHEMSI